MCIFHDICTERKIASLFSQHRLFITFSPPLMLNECYLGWFLLHFRRGRSNFRDVCWYSSAFSSLFFHLIFHYKVSHLRQHRIFISAKIFFFFLLLISIILTESFFSSLTSSGTRWARVSHRICARTARTLLQSNRQGITTATCWRGAWNYRLQLHAN